MSARGGMQNYGPGGTVLSYLRTRSENRSIRSLHLCDKENRAHSIPSPPQRIVGWHVRYVELRQKERKSGDGAKPLGANGLRSERFVPT